MVNHHTGFEDHDMAVISNPYLYLLKVKMIAEEIRLVTEILTALWQCLCFHKNVHRTCMKDVKVELLEWHT